MNLQSVLDILNQEKLLPVAYQSQACLNKLKLPTLSATTIEIFKEISKQQFSFPQLHTKLNAAEREIKVKIDLEENSLMRIAKISGLVGAGLLYADLIAVEILGIFRWPTVLFLNVPTVAWATGKFVQKLEHHKTFDAAIQALKDYRTYFTGDNYENMKNEITAKCEQEGLDKKIYKLAYRELAEANAFSK